VKLSGKTLRHVWISGSSGSVTYSVTVPSYASTVAFTELRT
jgi:hypothetical protein